MDPFLYELGKEDTKAPDTVDLGTLGIGEKRNLHFYLHNENPVPIRLQSWAANVSWCTVELVGVGKQGADGGHYNNSVSSFYIRIMILINIAHKYEFDRL